jgi:prepilin-type N-terminal cleavage/methylation domain-containing protein
MNRSLTPIRRGVTLLELIVSMAISALILGLITYAINNHFQVVEKQRMHVEEVQLARALLNRIAIDIKSAVQYEGVDVGSALDDISLDGVQELLGVTDMDALTTLGEVETESASYDYQTSFPVNLGLYGTQTAINFDISRIPRQEEYQTLYTADSINDLLDIPSDVKMISYYVRLGDGTANPSVQDVFNTSDSVPGLMRRQLSRAITSYAVENGNTEQLQNSDELLAPEVVAIEFRYFDGYEWLSEWDSDSYQAMPLAIEVLLTLESSSPYHSGGVVNAFYTDESLGSQSSAVTYRLVVRLPVGKIRPLDDTDQGMESLGL